MSKRGRRRNSNRRKSSSSSKQSASPFIFQKHNHSNSICYKDEAIEKGEADSQRKENVVSGSEDEDKNNSSPPKEKRFKQDCHLDSFPKQTHIYTKTTEDKEKGVKIVTSVSVNDLEDSSPKILFQQLHEPLSENQTDPAAAAAPLTNIMKINCSGSNVKLEIQEVLQPNSSSFKTTFVFTNEKGDRAETVFKSQCERTWTPNNESPPFLTNHSEGHTTNYTFTFGSTEGQCASVSPTRTWQNPNCCRCCSDHGQLIHHYPSNAPQTFNFRPHEKRKHFHKSFSIDQFWDVPPPQEFADMKYDTLEDLTFGLASCRIGSCSPGHRQSGELHTAPSITCKKVPECPYPAEEEALAFDQLSESDNNESTCMRRSLSTNRSSFTKEFISCQKRKSWIRNNSIATVEHRPCLLPKKRRQTFPGTAEGLGLMQEDLLLPYSESFSSMVMCSLPVQAERAGSVQQGNDQFPQIKESSKPDVQNCPDSKPSSLGPFCMSSSEDNPDDVFTVAEQTRKRSSVRSHGKDLRLQDLKLSAGRDRESLDTDDCEYKVDQSEVADSGFDQEMGEVEYHSSEHLTEEVSRRALAIQVIPPSCSGSEEQVLQSSPVLQLHNKMDDSNPPKHNKSSVMTITVGALEQRFLQMDSRSSLGGGLEKGSMRNSCVSLAQDTDSTHTHETIEEIESKPFSEQTVNTSTESSDLHMEPGRSMTEEPAASASSPRDAEVHMKEQLSKQVVSRGSLETKEHLKPVAHKDQESNADHWAKRRKLFKESKQWSSAGGSSITSDITEESVSEDTRSMDMTIRDNEDKGFYMETFHSSAWIYQGDDGGSGTIPPSLTTRTRAVSIRERTVRISKGTGEYPWGFRIQFSKPIVVTEVDTNGAAEEAGLLVGDYVLAVNGTDVTSIPHSEAADLARQGPDILTLTIGSDIARCPNTPRPACRGYLHKRTQSGLIKGWRKRWFVLTHDCCLNYYRHKRDEGKRQALSVVKLEGAEVGQDVSLGKPFVFKCRPQSGSRVYFFCATSNQEMKRWLEAMETAIHPIAQNHVWVDVTRHNSNLPPLAVKSPECLGLLHKLDRNKDIWVQHYCILKDGCLYLYSGIRATHAHGGIYLQGYTVREQPYGFKKSTIELKPLSDEFKTFYLCSENPNENKRWIVAIKASIKKWLPLHQALQEYMNRPPEETRM